jgi:hypothetical protein
MNAFKRQVRAILASFLPEEEVEGLMLVSGGGQTPLNQCKAALLLICMPTRSRFATIQSVCLDSATLYRALLINPAKQPLVLHASTQSSNCHNLLYCPDHFGDSCTASLFCFLVLPGVQVNGQG